MKKFLSVALALAMTLSLVVVGASAKSFTDNSKIKYGEAVDVVSAVKVVDGYTDGSFNPANTLTRGAAAKIICNMMLGPTTASALGVSASPFKDVSVKNVFAGYIAYCAKQGIINGYADKTFRPSGTVTGFQFLKMLLGTLGYDSAIEGFTGTNWEVTVAKLASNLKLFSGNDTFNGNKAMTREEACLYAYNTLTTNMVEYETKGSSIVVNGITISQGASKAKPIARTTGTDYTGAAETSTGTLQFCEQYFPKLTYSSTTNAFQAPAEKWKNGSSTIGTYTYDADKTYTAPVTVGKIYTDLGLSATPKTLTVYEDGKLVAAPAAITRGGTDTYGGNGAKTEVFANNSAKSDITIVVINTYVGRVSSVTAATAAKDRYVTVNALSTPAAGPYTFETDKFAAKDLVSYTVAWNGASAYEIQDMNALTKTATGKLASYTDGKNLTVADKTYDLSAKAAFDKNIGSYTPGSSDMDVYCDASGYALYVEGTQGVTNYATVIGKGSDNAYGSTSTGVTLLLADGTQKAVTAKMATSSAALTGDNTVADDVIGDLVTYSVDTNGVYTLKIAKSYVKQGETDLKAYAANSKNVTFTNNQSAMTITKQDNTTATYYTTSNTVFFVAKQTTANGPVTYSVYTGYAKMPSLTDDGVTGIAYSVNTANQVNAVYLSVKALKGVNAVDTYVVRNTNSAKTTDANGAYYVLPAIVDGKVTTVKISDAAIGSATGVVALKDVLQNNGIITSATVLPGNAAPYYKATGIVSADRGVIGVGTGTVTYFAYNDKTVVSTVDKDCTAFTASSVGAIGTDSTVQVYYTMDATNPGIVANIILVPAAEATYAVNAVTGLSFCTTVGGTYTAKLTGLKANTTVYVKVDNGYKITSTTPAVSAVAGQTNIYSFTMPAAAVTLTATSNLYATGVDSSLTGAAALKLDNATVSNSGVLTMPAATGVSISTQIQEAMAKLGYTGVTLSKTGSIYTIKGTKASVNETVTCDVATNNVTYYNKVTIDGTPKYVLATSTLASLGATGTASKSGSSFVLNSLVTTDGATYVSGYYALTVTAAVTEGTNHTNYVTALTAARTSTAAYVKTGDVVTIKVTAPSAITGTGVTLTSSVATLSGATTIAATASTGTTYDVTVTLGTVAEATTITLTATDKA